MEPVEAPLRKLNIGYTVITTVVGIKEHFKDIWRSGVGHDYIADSISLGWFVTFDGSREALYFGESKPHFELGDRVKITFEKI